MYNLCLSYVYFAHNQCLKTHSRLLFLINHEAYQIAAQLYTVFVVIVVM